MKYLRCLVYFMSREVRTAVTVDVKEKVWVMCPAAVMD